MQSFSAAHGFEIGRLDAHDQAALLRSGEVSRAELIEAAITRIEALDLRLNAVSWRSFDLARQGAAGPTPDAPMAGVPYLLKDSLEYPGMPTHAGSRSRGSAPATTAYPFARRFDAEGLIPLGKSNMPEFGLLASTEPLRTGPTNNPWALLRSPGGSSGGAAAAVAAGLVPLAHGSDGAGSIRIPSAACGVVGFKPSRGANLRARAANWLDDILCSDALIARSVRDVAWAFNAARPHRATEPQGKLPRLRIALVMQGMNAAAPHPDVAAAVGKTAVLCERLGHVVEPVARPHGHAEILTSLLEVLWPYGGREAVDHCPDMSDPLALDDQLEPWTIGLAEQCARTTPDRLEAALGALASAPSAFRSALADNDVMLTPTLAEPPPLTGALAPTRPFDDLMRAFQRFSPYAPLQNMAGSPAISLPLSATAAGLPVGSMFAADRGRDGLLLALARELEEAAPWADRWPPNSAAA